MVRLHGELGLLIKEPHFVQMAIFLGYAVTMFLRQGKKRLNWPSGRASYFQWNHHPLEYVRKYSFWGSCVPRVRLIEKVHKINRRMISVNFLKLLVVLSPSYRIWTTIFFSHRWFVIYRYVYCMQPILIRSRWYLHFSYKRYQIEFACWIWTFDISNKNLFHNSNIEMKVQCKSANQNEKCDWINERFQNLMEIRTNLYVVTFLFVLRILSFSHFITYAIYVMYNCNIL